MVCVEPTLGYFFRINTKGHWQISVPLPLEPHHKGFLRHDSYLECGQPLELDAYVIEESLKDNGVIGRIDPSLAKAICEATDSATTVSEADKAAILKALGH